MSSSFLQFAKENNALLFGEFTLKSGRISPYFFNSAQFNSGASLSRLSDFYADALIQSNLDFDFIFGPAYKGISLAAAVSISLYKRYGKDVSFASDRKEAKLHG